MDELEQLRGARPDLTPSELVTARHRAALRHEIARPVPAEATDEPDLSVHVPVLDLPAERRAPRRFRVAAAAAAVAVVAVGVGVGLRGSDDETPVATDPSVTAAPPAVSAGRCGPLPFDLPELDGFGPVTTGPSGDAASQPSSDLLAVHRDGPTASVEVRWPSGAETRFVLRPEDDPPAGMSWAVGGHPRPMPSGRLAVSMEVHDPSLSSDLACQSVWFLVAADTEAEARVVGSRLYTLLGEPGSAFGGEASNLVVSSTTADAPPEIPPCGAPDGIEHVDRVGGSVELGTHATPQDALTAFIDSKRVDDVDPFGVPIRRHTTADRGFVETHLPDGSIAYVFEVGRGVTVVHAVRDGEGWTVDSWDATGC